MPQIDILMATYNGAAYIAAQIRSLQNQDFTDWQLIVHDDASTDDTVEIVRGFASADARIELIEDGKRFGNSGGNFMHLLQFSKAPFTAFCDQDDVWLENKLSEAHKAITQKDNSRPQMVYSNAYVYTCENAAIDGFATSLLPRRLQDVLFGNGGIQGCALLFNAALRDIVARHIPEKVAMHDHVLTLAALTFGELTYVDKRLMLYRRHATTVTGETHKNAWQHATHFFEANKTVLDQRHVEAIVAFVEAYKEDISSEKRAIFQDFARFLSESRLKRIVHALRGGYNLYGHHSILAFKLLIRNLI